MREYVETKPTNTPALMRSKEDFARGSKLYHYLNQTDFQAWELRIDRKNETMSGYNKLSQVFRKYLSAGVKDFNLIFEVEAQNIGPTSASFTGRVMNEGDFIVFYSKFKGTGNNLNQYSGQTIEINTTDIIDNRFHFTLNNLKPGESYCWQMFQKPVLIFPAKKLYYDTDINYGERTLEVIVGLLDEKDQLMLDSSIRHRLIHCPETLDHLAYIELHWPRIPQAREYLVYLVAAEEDKAYLMGRPKKNNFILHREIDQSDPAIPLIEPETNAPYSTLNREWSGESGLYRFTAGSLTPRF